MLLNKNSTNSYVKQAAGGKGYNLYVLTREGLPVPKWVILDIEEFQRFKKANDLDTQIHTFLEPLKKASPTRQQISTVSQNVQKLLIEIPFDKTTSEQINNAYKELKSANIAVRSSAFDEDAAHYSFAGQLDSFLGITSIADAMLAVKRCWASAYSERNLSYRIQNKLPLTAQALEMAVIFQETIQADTSGVVFTCDPINKDATKVFISSVFGLGEGVVSGRVDADTFLLNKKTSKLIDKTIVLKKTHFVVNSKKAGTKEITVPRAKQQIPSLHTQEIKTVVHHAVLIEKLFRFPQDVEWAIKDGSIYILQTRPVTTDILTDDGVLNIWDNSNIVESYGGLTLPLTYTFARYVYHQVYVQFCELLFIPQKEIRAMDSFLKNMLGLFYGRVYYNLLNWYKLTSLLPGYKYNRSFMETMMGTNKQLETEIAERIRPPVTQNLFIKTLTGCKFLYYHFVIQKKVDAFVDYFQETYNTYRRKDYSKMTADEILTIYHELENSLLREWKAPIINDFLCMVHFGILKKLSKKWLGHRGDALQNDLLCGVGNLESTEPTKALIRIANEAKKIPQLKQLLLETPANVCMEKLNQSDFTACKKSIDKYIDLYGYRCMNEMKLEQKDLYQDPSFLFTCLKNYLQSDTIHIGHLEVREREIRQRAEKLVSQNLNGLRQLIYFWSLHHTRKAVRNREQTRFCRTRIYGVVRAWFYNIGRDFTLRRMIEKPEDIFYLEVDEVLGAIEGSLSVQDLPSLIQLRKDAYKQYESVEPASRFSTRGPVYWLNNHVNKSSHKQPNAPARNVLKGVGCCPGIVTGKVKIILSPEDTMRLHGEILVTPRTDPGWIPLYPTISGLVIERGSLLSHSAIVAREMGIPTIVGVSNATQILKEGMIVTMDGERGIVEQQ